MLRLAVVLTLISCAAACAGRSVIVDAAFPYYKDRGVESIVGEIKANDYDDVRLVCTSEAKISGDLVKAFGAAGVKVWLQTFGNGVYAGADLPKGWEAWRMKLRKDDTSGGFTYLCVNNPAYREWKKKQLTTALAAHPFHGIDLAETYFPADRGPENSGYGCLCESCATAFKKMYPEAEALPDFEDAKSPRYWKTDKTLCEKWVGFRVASIVSFLDDLVNGKDGIREKCPDVKVCAWTLGLNVPDQVKKLREWQGLDAAAIVRRVKPDMMMIQTNWPDWIRADLSADYPLKYKPIADSIREASPKTALMLQCDIGSQKQMRRGREWIKEAEEAGKKIGCQAATHYEYHLGDYIYTEPPAVVRAEPEPGIIKLVFNKRLDPMAASNISNYSINSGRIDFARVDGNIVRLSVSGTDDSPIVTVSGLSDDEARRFFHDKPACTMPESQQVAVR